MPHALAAKAAKLALKVSRRSPASMPDKCLIISTGRVRDVRGGSSVTPTGIPEYTPADLVPCRVEGRAGQEREVGGLVQSTTIYTVRLMALKPDGKTPVRVAQKDRIYVLPRDPLPGRMLEVETMAYREGVSIDVVALLKSS